MAQDLLPRYQKRDKNVIALVVQLSKNKEVVQFELKKIMGCSHRTIMRELSVLENLGLVKLTGTKRIKKRGRARNIWKATFECILLGIHFNFSRLFSDADSIWISRLDIIEFWEEIAKAHEDEWIIFNEWDYLNKKNDTEAYLFQNIQQTFQYPLGSEKWFIGNPYGFMLTYKAYRKNVNKISNLVGEENMNSYKKHILSKNEDIKRKVAYKVLGLDNFLKGHAPSHILDYYMKNLSLRRFIIGQYNQVEEICLLRFNAIKELKLNYGID